MGWWGGAWAFAAMLALPGVLLAHARLTSSIPLAGAHVALPPRAIRLWFSEEPETALTTISVTGPGAERVALGIVARDSASRLAVMAPIMEALAPGRYVVVWQTAAADAHPSRGRFAFFIDSATTLATTAAGARSIPALDVSPAGDFGAGSLAYVAIRWASFMALLTLIGVVVFYFFVLRTLSGRDAAPLRAAIASRLTAVGRWAALALTGLAPLRLIAQSYAMHGASAALDVQTMATMIDRTGWGWAWRVQLIASAGAFVGLLLTRTWGRAAWVIVAGSTIVLGFTPGLSGHAAASHSAPAILLDGIHVLAAGGWMGTLMCVISVGIYAAARGAPDLRGRVVASLVNAFSPVALLCATLAVTTGVVSAVTQVGHVTALVHTEYGAILLTKVAVLSVALGTGAYNWRVVRPALGGDAASARLRRSATLEVAVGIVVLGITAVLVASPSPVSR
ncbi:MAG: hypothetical protein NVS1B4_14860 [Gemmatimonadaceae bacterium]